MYMHVYIYIFTLSIPPSLSQRPIPRRCSAAVALRTPKLAVRTPKLAVRACKKKRISAQQTSHANKHTERTNT